MIYRKVFEFIMSDVEIFDLCAYQILAYLHRMPGSMTTSIYDYVLEGSKNTKQTRLKHLVDKGLVQQRYLEHENNRYNIKRYDLTQKGEEILTLLTKINNILND